MSALIALLLVTAPPVERIVLDVPLLLTASAPASGVETVLVPWFGVRGGRHLDVSALVLNGLSVGADAGLFAGGIENEGTPDVAATRFFAALEGRGVVGWRAFSTTHSALTPYGFLGARGTGGLSAVRVFDDTRVSFLAGWGARIGGGIDLAIAHLNVRSELAAGARDGRLELSSALSLGAVF